MRIVARAGLTTQILVEAGAALADREGFEAVTPSALARHFGVQVASLYSHLSNAHDLKTRVALLALDRLADLAAEAVAGRAGNEALMALGHVHRDFARDHPGLFAATRYRLDDAAVAGSGGMRLSHLMRAVLRGYHLAEPGETHAIRLLGSVFLGFATLELDGGFSHSAPDAAASWAWSLEALDAVLRSWPTKGPTP